MTDILKHLKKGLQTTKHPAKTLEILQSQFDKTLQDFYQMLESPRFSMMSFEDLTLNPSINILDDEKLFTIQCEMPGMDEKDVHIEVQEGMLIIKGEKENIEQNHQNNHYILREIGYGLYERRILLPKNVDLDHANASFQKGILCVSIPKKAEIPSELRELKIGETLHPLQKAKKWSASSKSPLKSKKALKKAGTLKGKGKSKSKH